jgi:broad specificity phosphatase PhoE
MKWPAELVLVRHAQSTFNVLRGLKSVDPVYTKFKLAYERDYRSFEARELAEEVLRRYKLNVGDYNTEITDLGVKMATTTGAALSQIYPVVPDVVFVSPYLRTRQTLHHMMSEWPKLDRAKFVYEDRIREQEHGLALAYNDWRVFHVMHPEQKVLWDMQGKYWYQYPQGESVSQVRDRIRSFVDTLIREYAEQRVMLVTHHLTILSIRSLLERLSPEEFVQLDETEKPVNCGVTIYRGNAGVGREGRLELVEYNTKHY